MAGQTEPINLTASPEEQIILDTLTGSPLHIDDLIKRVKLSPSKVNALLTMLEMKNRIKNLGGGHYAKIR